MNNLQEHHKKNFEEVNERLGLTSENEVLKSLSNDILAKKDTIVFGADEASCDIVGKVIPVPHIAELKRLSGVPSDGDDTHVQYVEKPAVKYNSSKNISDSEKEDIAKAATAYILGDPEKVKDYEDAINDTLFPGKAVLFSVENLYVKNGQTVVFGSTGEPEIYNFGTITIEKGGQLSVVGNIQLTCQLFTQL
ncbi:hypothetical protein GKZ90_0006250 [Flavobacterium sp. MC2016-06]|jgi:hypothetical protein|uniref:hypothetical protein n=1 Tax=Flavobacterium sp. MC2016-06 TaxID=2676308 RepID=UPI0012BAF320|nr:hypothetical protein [Flavobacterium sp. MC2016-06]MBU3857740.1 hypothetical protein [Flavobacterium sp. MC2016-06]